jgi:hypothetical protein
MKDRRIRRFLERSITGPIVLGIEHPTLAEHREWIVEEVRVIQECDPSGFWLKPDHVVGPIALDADLHFCSTDKVADFFIEKTEATDVHVGLSGYEFARRPFVRALRISTHVENRYRGNHATQAPIGCI